MVSIVHCLIRGKRFKTTKDNGTPFGFHCPHSLMIIRRITRIRNAADTYALERYSPLLVSILILSPMLQKSGTAT